MKRMMLLTLAVVLALCTPAAWAQDIKGKLAFPDEWTVFVLPGGSEKALLEASLLTTLPDRVIVQGQSVEARKVRVKANRLDLVPLFGNLTMGNTAYVFVRLDSPQKQSVTLGLGADWWMQAWINGKEFINTLETGNIDWPPQMTNYTRTIDLAKGVNILAVKFISGTGSSILTIGGPQDLKKIPADQWSQMGNATQLRTSFAMPRVASSPKGIDDLSKASIVIPLNATAVETTAARELSSYLAKATGSPIRIIPEPDVERDQGLIYVGATNHAQKQGIDLDSLSSEQWLVRSVDGNLIITGGRSRGILYGAYHFLEKVVGVRWWNPWEEFVPEHESLASGELDLSGTPVLKQRHLNTYSLYMTQQGAERAWAPRNRVNLELHMTWKPGMSAEYGGGIAYGPPAFVHSESHYYRQMQQRGYLKPEWVALRNGQRQIKTNAPATEMQLCLSNQEMREAFLMLLKEHIARSRKLEVPPTMFDVSFNDTSSKCQCEDCAAIVNQYGKTDAGLMLDFINQLADGIKEEYPDILLSTLAYMNTEPVPQGIVPRDNVVIVLCDTLSDYTAPIPGDGRFAQLLAGWSRITNKIKIWDYHTTFSDYAVPMPFEMTLPTDLQLFHKYGVWGVMTEFHSPIYEDMRDLRLWLMAKLYEDPYQDLNRLIHDFTDGYYGPSGVFIREYLAELSQDSLDHPSSFATQRMLESAKHLTPETLVKYQAIFDKAEKAAGTSQTLLRRVRHARLAVDKAAYILFPRIQAHHQQAGKSLSFSRQDIASRVEKTVDEQHALRASNLLPRGASYAQRHRERFVNFLEEEILWENCDNLERRTWGQLAWSPRWFQKEEVGKMALSTDIKQEGQGSIRWTVTHEDVRLKLQEQPKLQVIRMNYLHGSDFARNRIVKFYIKCETPNHPPLFAGLTGRYRPIKILDRGEVTDGWKEVIWDLGEEAGQTSTHTYFRLFASPEDFKEGDVMDIYLDNMRLVR